MKKILVALMLCMVSIAVFVSCERNTPSCSTNGNMSPEDSLVLSYKTKLIGDTSLIWWRDGIWPNITTFAVMYKFKKDSVLCIECGWLGYDGNDDEHFSIKRIEKRKYDIRIDNTMWNAYLKMGSDVYSFTMEDSEYPSHFKLSNTKYSRSTSKFYENIDAEVSNFMRE